MLPQILFLADTSHHTGAVRDHIQAVTSVSTQFDWHIVNPLSQKCLDKIDFAKFDAIGIHYSIKPYNYYYLSKALQKKIAAFKGLKFLFLQDEYQRVNEVQAYIARLGFDILFTLVHDLNITKAYPDAQIADVEKITVLTGYVSPDMKTLNPPKIKDRTIDVSYRARRCDYYLGSLSYEKQWIGDKFLEAACSSHLKMDISLEESARLYGQDWINFLQNSKVVLGTESGASIWDFDRSIERAVYNYLAKHRKASFDEVYDAVLKPHDGKILYNAISPRVFEAAANKTVMLMFPGYYNGILIEDKHYIKLEKDFSNISVVLLKLQDIDFLQKIADFAYEDLILSGKYDEKHFSELIAQSLVSKLAEKKQSCTDSHLISAHLNDTFSSYRFYNKCLQISTELKFIIYNLWQLVTDKRLSFSKRMSNLAKQGRRYFAYLLPRF